MEPPADGQQRRPVGRPPRERRPVGRPRREGPVEQPPADRQDGPVEQPPADRQQRRPVGRPPHESQPVVRPVGRPARPVGPAERPVGRRPSPPARSFEEEDPIFEGNLQACPLSEKDKPIKKKFDEALAAEKMVRCERCKRRWFDVVLKGDGICKHCHGKDDKKRLDEPFFYSEENHLDFGDVPDFLPALHPAEEMVIARVHVSVNFFP
jgi:ATP-dependent DNA helicase PIF1